MARLRRHDDRSSSSSNIMANISVNMSIAMVRQARLTMLAALFLFAAGVSASSSASSSSLSLSLSSSTSTTFASPTTMSATSAPVFNVATTLPVPSLTVYVPGDAPTTGAAAATGILRDYTYQGCFLDINGLNGTAAGSRSLQGDTTDEVLPGDMTVAKCIAFCGGGGSGTAYTYAGLEYARECWCGQDLAALATMQPEAQCDLPCDGDNSTVCGGNLRLTLYMLKSPAERPAAALGAVLAVAGLAVAAQLML